MTFGLSCVGPKLLASEADLRGLGLARSPGRCAHLRQRLEAGSNPGSWGPARARNRRKSSTRCRFFRGSLGF